MNWMQQASNSIIIEMNKFCGPLFFGISNVGSWAHTSRFEKVRFFTRCKNGEPKLVFSKKSQIEKGM